MRDNIDLEILEELLSLGGLGIQYCIKTQQAYSKLQEIKEKMISVDYTEFNDKYNLRDVALIIKIVVSKISFFHSGYWILLCT